ncbi:MAG: Tyrosyl-tRNA synthetase [Parcubacteria group bacterium GW2011_GWC1_38_6]|nr:MAG: Tyrosine-tRNA ligase [Parcubacteria group bacterium GW2011_GWA1_36_12]KKQ76826.1 MAG: Tyrosyl-tRNA synthetase [Parcubacteria group bacterium GW2011_GWC1_38_6]
MNSSKDRKIKNILTRGVEKIYPNSAALEAVLRSSKKIRLYNGIDPTGHLHLGHLSVLKKLRQFQDLGHEVIVLIGDFTATIGDPTDKYAARKPLTRKQALENAKNYKIQIGKVLDFKKPNVRFLHNAKWINKLKPNDLLKIFSQFTVARLLERDMFQKRISEGRDILLHEFVYPVFQAYDGLVMSVDLEIGGNDQTFNMLRGRDLMKKIKNKEKFIMALKLLTDSTGKKMGKTDGNFVSLSEGPEEIFGKIMAWPDSLLASGLELLTDIFQEEIEKILTNPKKAKVLLAKEIVRICHSDKEANLAEKEFKRVFEDKQVPFKVPEVRIAQNTLSILDLLVKIKLASSKSEAKRLILQGGVKIDGVLQKDWKEIIETKKAAGGESRNKRGQIVQVGKRKFAKII